MTTGITDSDTGPPAGLCDFSASIGSFVMLSQNGRLFALDGIGISTDLAKLVPRMNGADFRCLHPLVSRVTASNIVLVLHPGEGGGQAYFLIDLKLGAQNKKVKVRQGTTEVIANALEEGVYPIIQLGELQKSLLKSRQNQAPISVPIRYLELREAMPGPWKDAVKEVFRANAEGGSAKSEALERRVADLRDAVKSFMFEDFLTKCIWLDTSTGALGSTQVEGSSLRFTPYEAGDIATLHFVHSLAKDGEGHFETRQGFANVIPAPTKRHSWLSPTLHVYDEFFRLTNGLEEYYSLHRGFKALSEVGAPVLLYDRNHNVAQIPVALLRPAMGGDDVSHHSVMAFPTKGVVWSGADFA